MKRKLLKVLLATLIAVAMILLWRGVWGLADLYIFPSNKALSLASSVIIGLLVLIYSKELVKHYY